VRGPGKELLCRALHRVMLHIDISIRAHNDNCTQAIRSPTSRWLGHKPSSLRRTTLDDNLSHISRSGMRHAESKGKTYSKWPRDAQACSIAQSSFSILLSCCLTSWTFDKIDSRMIKTTEMMLIWRPSIAEKRETAVS
jgi:hypothetical protein